VLARVNRIVQGDELRRVSRRGKKFRSPLFSAAFLSNPHTTPTRFGFITSKNVGGAVTRNLVKRRLRSLAARTISAHPVGHDVVVRAHAEASRATFSELAHEWERMVRELEGP
jgi:ribonuclease P protein component